MKCLFRVSQVGPEEQHGSEKSVLFLLWINYFSCEELKLPLKAPHNTN